MFAVNARLPFVRFDPDVKSVENMQTRNECAIKQITLVYMFQNFFTEYVVSKPWKNQRQSR